MSLRIWAVLLLSSVCAQDALRQVNILFRHGDRTPTGTFPGNPDNVTWTQGYGQLTTTGMMQQYQLGKFFQDRYVRNYRLLGPEYNRADIDIRSTNVDRTLQSAECQLAGWFPPERDQVWNPMVQWQPIPVHTTTFSTDFLLNMEENCDVWNQLWQEQNDNGDVKAFYDKNKAMLLFIASQIGLPMNSTVDDISYPLADILYIERLYNRTLPKWANDTVMDLLQKCQENAFTYMFKGPAMSRVRGGFLMKEMLSNMDALSSMDIKVYLYSAHDVDVSALLNTLQVYDNLLPPYAAAVMLELWQTASAGYEVKIYYMKGPDDINPLLMIVPGCAENCPLDQLKTLLKDYLPTGTFDEECKNPSGAPESDDAHYIQILTITCGALGGALAIMVVAFIVVLVRRKRKGYEGIQ